MQINDDVFDFWQGGGSGVEAAFEGKVPAIFYIEVMMIDSVSIDIYNFGS